MLWAYKLSCLKHGRWLYDIICNYIMDLSSWPSDCQNQCSVTGSKLQQMRLMKTQAYSQFSMPKDFQQLNLEVWIKRCLTCDSKSCCPWKQLDTIHTRRHLTQCRHHHCTARLYAKNFYCVSHQALLCCVSTALILRVATHFTLCMPSQKEKLYRKWL